MSTKVFLIRHGETDLSRQKRYCGIIDPPLNQNGRQQALDVCKKLGEQDFDNVYSSNMKRTIESAEIIFKGRQIEALKAFNEIAFGVFEGFTYGEVMNKFPDVYQKWLTNPVDAVIPKAEGLKDLAKRVRTALEKVIFSNKNKTIAIVTHAGPISVILCGALDLALQGIWKVPINLASVNVIEFTKGKGRVLKQNE